MAAPLDVAIQWQVFDSGDYRPYSLRNSKALERQPMATMKPWQLNPMVTSPVALQPLATRLISSVNRMFLGANCLPESYFFSEASYILTVTIC